MWKERLEDHKKKITNCFLPRAPAPLVAQTVKNLPAEDLGLIPG